MAGVVQKGLKNILQKNPHDVVFLSALRTPVTRAKKGGLRDAYDHELLAAVRFATIPSSMSVILTSQ
jgi:acetyl-CoA acyltransferase 1